MRTSPFYGNVTVGSGSVVQITTSDERLERGLLVKSSETNNGIIYVGFNDLVTTGNGYPLNSGAELVLPVLDPSNIHAISNTDNNDLRFIGM